MTPEACASATISTSDSGDTYKKQLIDARDGKTYWVAKLADNNCWMTQNMDHNVGKLNFNDSKNAYLSKYGGYYTWYSAVDVCTSMNGWTLPSSAQYNALFTTYNIGNNTASFTTIQNAPLNFVIGGNIRSSNLDNANTYGFYWTSTGTNEGSYYRNAVYIRIISTGVASSGENPPIGYSVRCIAR